MRKINKGKKRRAAPRAPSHPRFDPTKVPPTIEGNLKETEAALYNLQRGLVFRTTQEFTPKQFDEDTEPGWRYWSEVCQNLMAVIRILRQKEAEREEVRQRVEAEVASRLKRRAQRAARRERTRLDMELAAILLDGQQRTGDEP